MNIKNKEKIKTIFDKRYYSSLIEADVISHEEYITQLHLSKSNEVDINILRLLLSEYAHFSGTVQMRKMYTRGFVYYVVRNGSGYIYVCFGDQEDIDEKSNIISVLKLFGISVVSYIYDVDSYTSDYEEIKIQ